MCVLSVTEATVPIVTPKDVLTMLPTLISVVKDVPDPVIADEPVLDVILPVREVLLDHAVPLQFPVELLVIVTALSVDPPISKIMASIIFTI